MRKANNPNFLVNYGLRYGADTSGLTVENAPEYIRKRAYSLNRIKLENSMNIAFSTETPESVPINSGWRGDHHSPDDGVTPCNMIEKYPKVRSPGVTRRSRGSSVLLNTKTKTHAHEKNEDRCKWRPSAHSRHPT